MKIKIFRVDRTGPSGGRVVHLTDSIGYCWRCTEMIRTSINLWSPVVDDSYWYFEALVWGEFVENPPPYELVRALRKHFSKEVVS